MLDIQKQFYEWSLIREYMPCSSESCAQYFYRTKCICNGKLLFGYYFAGSSITFIESFVHRLSVKYFDCCCFWHSIFRTTTDSSAIVYTKSKIRARYFLWKKYKFYLKNWSCKISLSVLIFFFLVNLCIECEPNIYVRS